MNKLDLDYQNLLKDILENGVKKKTRNGEVLSVFGRQIRHSMKNGFPVLTTKKNGMEISCNRAIVVFKGGYQY